jgi:hypothetical protein
MTVDASFETRLRSSAMTVFFMPSFENPHSESLTGRVRLWPWIPAFAGMTMKRDDSIHFQPGSRDDGCSLMP